MDAAWGAGREGQREKLSDSGMCSLLCHLLLARASCSPAIPWKIHSANAPCSGALRALVGFLGRSAVLLVVTRTQTCDSTSNSSAPRAPASCEPWEEPRLPAPQDFCSFTLPIYAEQRRGLAARCIWTRRVPSRAGLGNAQRGLTH